jgi:hypothetical protein
MLRVEALEVVLPSMTQWRLAALRLLAARLPARRLPGPTVTFVGHALRRWLTLFFVPALAVRYAVTFGTTPELAAGAGLLVAATAIGFALRDVSDSMPGERDGRRLLALLGQLGCAVVAGLAAACAAAHWATGLYYEATLLQAMGAFLVTAIAVCGLADMRAGRRRPSPAGPHQRPE